jgi:predicted lipoprotein with Yx(FWY)xxD motif
LPTISGWQERGLISGAILMAVKAAGTLYTFDRDMKGLSKAD